ncbi:amino acid racemase, partial [Xanthomonas sp. Kuri4-2]
GRAMAAAARALQAGGADFVVLCTNTMHRVAEAIVQATPLPLLHIAEATADALAAAGLTRVGLLGTRFTLEQPFYRDHLRARGIATRIPDEAMRERLHRIIYDELCQGVVRADSRQVYRQAMADLVAAGAEAVVLGCTEIMLLVRAEDAAVPLFDTTALHAEAAALRSLGPGAPRPACARPPNS